MSRKRSVDRRASVAAPKRGELPPGASKPIWIARLCFFAASALTAWLLWYALTEKPMAGCGPGSPCDRVMGSSWAYFLNVPVSAPALTAYIGLLISSAAVTSRKAVTRNRAWNAAFCLAILVISSAAYFTWLQVAIVRSICKFCTSAHLLSVTGCILLLTQMPRAQFREANGTALRLAKPALLALVALMAFGSLVAAQKFGPRKTNFLTVVQTGMNFDLREVPVIGSPSNQRYIVSLFDYTCPDCYDMHALLMGALKKFDGAFSIVALPMPLDATCNPHIGVTKPKHMHACDYARLGLCVRRCGEDFFQQYDNWYFSRGGVPPLEEATAYAEKLVGKTDLDKVRADPWPDQMIQTSISIYENNGRWTRSYRLPQIMIGDNVNMGPVRNLDELVALLERKLPDAAKAHR
ncbi:MAG TPA: vitamin K epoxide reductase family protein [Verrucomicrobiae bacterium]